MSSSNHVQPFFEFLQKSPTPFHAVQSMANTLLSNGFEPLDEKNIWQLKAGGAYFYSRADSSLIAFVVGTEEIAQTGMRLVGAHTDSPCLKVKPNPQIKKHQYLLLGVEVYGGVLLNPWFDRDLSLAGKVVGLDNNGHFCSTLIDFCDPIATVPSLAIHLNRSANKDKTVNAQNEMNVLLALEDDSLDFKSVILNQVAKENSSLQMKEILDFNLSFYDVQAPQKVGLKQEFIAAARLDNLLSTYAGFSALIHARKKDSTPKQTMAFISNDHEEVGSNSEPGAQGTMLSDLVERLTQSSQERQQALRHSLMLSVDNAHALHPNYADKHDQSHGPKINDGPVIKYNANQAYATSSETASMLKYLAGDIPLQSFAVRADMRCGSTIGPITASNVGIRTVDLGVATFAMHSIRELGGVQDLNYLVNLLEQFYATQVLP